MPDTAPTPVLTQRAAVVSDPVKLTAPQEIELDGDPIGMTSGFRATVDRGGLRVRVPAAAA